MGDEGIPFLIKFGFATLLVGLIIILLLIIVSVLFAGAP